MKTFDEHKFESLDEEELLKEISGKSIEQTVFPNDASFYPQQSLYPQLYRGRFNPGGRFPPPGSPPGNPPGKP